MTEPPEERFTGNIPKLVADALARYELSDVQLAQLTAVLSVLESDDRAPTTVRAPAEAVWRHLADALTALDVDLLEDCRVMADLGSGAGFPGVAIAVALPQSHVRLLESQRRKCEFLGRLLSIAAIENAEVVCARTEEWAQGRGANDLAFARALAPQPVVLEYAAPLLRVGGALVDWRGKRDAEEESQAKQASQVLGFELHEIRAVEPFASATDRHLHVWIKTGETPPRFPRRPGIARKRQLSG
ncbi:MAG TPA: 16S rRNA (guanine(527)-N(7))-methyltransferase RsmG [Solirubrobacteraceae bacterium]|nr:16S rRNA (guanine(527)-N(7))-methyltransferase RsmG [Solirubrobacteraceae bacterium]